MFATFGMRLTGRGAAGSELAPTRDKDFDGSKSQVTVRVRTDPARALPRKCGTRQNSLLPRRIRWPRTWCSLGDRRKAPKLLLQPDLYSGRRGEKTSVCSRSNALPDLTRALLRRSSINGRRGRAGRVTRSKKKASK